MDIVNVSANPAYGEVGALLEVSVQFIYLGALLALLGVGSFLVVRQVLIRRELESAAKELQVPHEIIFTDLVTEQTLLFKCGAGSHFLNRSFDVPVLKEIPSSS